MEFVPVQTFDNYIDAHILLGRLVDGGIQCWLKDENTVTVSPFFSNAVGGIKLMVAREQLEEAIELIDLLRQEKKNKLECIYCGSHNIELIPSRKPLNLLTAVATWLIGRYAISTENVWHCFECNKDFDEPKNAGPTSNEVADVN